MWFFLEILRSFWEVMSGLTHFLTYLLGSFSELCLQLLKRMIRVDHVEEYKVPKYREDVDEEIRRLWEEGCAPKPINITQGCLSII